MKKFIYSFFIGALASLSLLISPAHAGVQDFSIPEFTADYYLTRDAQGVSRMRVEETIVAEFPASDQNHGILRALPVAYQDHPLALSVKSVTNEAGQDLDYDSDSENNNKVLKIGNSDEYVHGRQTYHISYTMGNVTTVASGHTGLFWNVNGTQWQQTFGQVTAKIHLPADISSRTQPEHNRCFTGASGSTDQACRISVSPDSTSGTIVTVTTTQGLTAGQTLSYELGFTPNTFSAYREPLSSIILRIADIIFLGVLPPILAYFFSYRRWRKHGRDPKGRGVIVPEYIPPKELSVLSANGILTQGFQTKALSAQIIDLAIRGYIKVYELSKKKILGSTTNYELELMKTGHDLPADEKDTLVLLFGESAKPGDRFEVSSASSTLHAKAMKLGESVMNDLVKTGYFPVTPEKAKMPMIIGGIIMLIASPFVLPVSIGLAIAGVILVVFGLLMPARTPKGVAMRDYLLGLKMYIKLAEADRIKTLQSPHGSLIEKIDVNDTKQLLKLYERLLPYAMLFGIEKDWSAELGKLYPDAPDWYVGHGAFQYTTFASFTHSFNSAGAVTFASPTSSGSGGSAGGGGGGGGGGGW